MKGTRQVRSGMRYGVVMTLTLLAIAGTIAACCEWGPGVRSPGYWKNHPCDWPVDCITIGCVRYTKAEAIDALESPVQGDKTYTLFKALVAAKLNVYAGNCSYCISDTICKADAWFCKYPLGSDVRGNSAAWKCGEPLYLCLDAYNNGLLCAPPADD